MSKLTGKSRNRLLVTAGSALAATIAVTGAHAAQTEVGPINPVDPSTTTADVNGDNIPLDPSTQDAIGSLQRNVANVLAQVRNTVNGVGQADAATTQTSIVVDTNKVSGSASGNIFVNSIDLFTTENDEDGDGSASLGVQINAEIDDDAIIRTIVEANQINVDLEDFENGSVSVSKNSISGEATGNSGTTKLAGSIPNKYASTLAGSSTLTTAGDALIAEGSLLSSTVQVNFGTVRSMVRPHEGSLKITSGGANNAISLDLTSQTDNTVSSAPVLDDNTIASTATGNSSNSTIDIQNGNAPTYEGSAVVTNGQANVGEVLAMNDDSDIEATIVADGVGEINTLAGSLSVEGNTVSSMASGNEALGNGVAGNRIVLDDGMSFDGPGNTASSSGSTFATVGTSTVEADLAIHSSQGNTIPSQLAPLEVTAQLSNSDIDGYVQALEDGSVSVSENTQSATARGNAATSGFASGKNAATFSGSVAVANQQVNYNTDILAENSVSTILATVDNDGDEELEDGSVSVDDNTQAARAYGSQSGQTLAVAAAVVDLPADGVVLAGGSADPANNLEGNVSADGGAIVTNLQLTYESTVTAELDGAWTGVQITSDDLVDSQVSLSGNTQEAVALGASTSNSVSVASTGLDGGAGIASVQVTDNEVAISATAAVETSASAEDEVTGSSIDLSSNVARAVAYGGSAANTLSVDAEVVDVEGNEDIASVVTLDPEESFVLDNDGDEQPVVEAAYGVLNIQSTSADISSTLGGYDGAPPVFVITVGDSIDAGSSLTNEDNVAAAAAYGADAVNKALLDVGNLTSDDDFASVANVTNAQTLTSDSTVTAEASGNLMATQVGVNVVDSSVSTSDNTAQAVAYGNLADNELAVASTNIDNGDSTATGIGLVEQTPFDDVEASTDASFTLNNVQAAAGSITASLVDQDTPLDPFAATTIFTIVGNSTTGTQGDIDGSSVVSNGNALSAGATANRADNLLDLSGNTLTTTASLVSFQNSDADLTALIGIEGSDPTPFIEGTDDTPAHVAAGAGSTGAPTTIGYDGSNITVSGPIVITIGSHAFTQAEVDYLNGLPNVSGATLGGSQITLENGGAIPASLFAGFIFNPGGDSTAGTGNESFTVTGLNIPFVAGIPDQLATNGTPNLGGVIVQVRDDVIDSTVAVNGNTIAGSVTGNSASNAVVVEGTEVAHANDQANTLVELRDGEDDDAGNDTGEFGEVVADFGLNNVQTVGESAISSEVYSTLAIDLEFVGPTTFENSTLTIDDNTQSSRAVANTASNSVDLVATNTDAGAALGSSQFGDATVEAVSNLDIYVPVSALETSVSVSDNTNLALAVSNNVTNELTVSATNADPVDAVRDVRLLSDGNIRAAGDHILANQQVTTEDVTATAETNIWNDDYLNGTTDVLITDGIRSSTIAVEGNATIAEATANRAINTADVSASATLAASAGLANFQVTGELDVTSNATTTATVFLGTADDPLVDVAVDAGSVTLGNNTTSSLARGNAATNVLNYSAGSNYGGTTAGSDPFVSLNASGTGENTIRARAGVLNNQANGAAVTANTVNTSYVIALNSSDVPVASNATIGVIGNAVSATAYGNSASNTIAVTALNTNAASAAIGNVQTNTGPVTATVTTVSYGITTGVGAAFGSALGVTSNAITATAAGNTSINTIAAGN